MQTEDSREWSVGDMQVQDPVEEQRERGIGPGLEPGLESGLEEFWVHSVV